MMTKLRSRLRLGRKHRPGEPLRSRILQRLARTAKRKRKLTVISRYETGMILSEIVTGLLFIAGSISMFYPQTERIPTVLYLTGSIMMLLRSGLRASYRFRLKSLEKENPDRETTGDDDWSR